MAKTSQNQNDSKTKIKTSIPSEDMENPMIEIFKQKSKLLRKLTAKMANDNSNMRFYMIDAEKNPVSRKLAKVDNLPTFAFFKNGRVTIDLELSFYPFYFASALAMWLSVIAIILWFIKTIFEKNKL